MGGALYCGVHCQSLFAVHLLGLGSTCGALAVRPSCARAELDSLAVLTLLTSLWRMVPALSLSCSVAGREDIDVRMLGSGRPFALEVRNARALPPSPQQLAVMQRAINEVGGRSREWLLVFCHAFLFLLVGHITRQSSAARHSAGAWPRSRHLCAVAYGRLW